MSEMQLKNRHLIIPAEIAIAVFGDTPQVYVVYYPQQRSLLLAPQEDELFPTVHKAGLGLLKIRNAAGDRSLSLEEIIIDHELEDETRTLVCLYQPGLRLLHVTL